MNDVKEHRPTDSFEIDGKWCTPCACGLRFTGSSPSTAYSKCTKHVGKQSPRTPETPTVPARAKICGCGCGEPLAARAGGLFRSGHDARFKSILTSAHATGTPVRHPYTGEQNEAIEIAGWLDERRGGGSEFWRNKVLAGHKPQPERKPRPAAEVDEEARIKSSHHRVDLIMEFQATRRPVPGDVGVVKIRSGQFGAQVLRRRDDENLEVRLLEGSARGQEIVISDSKFSKAAKK